jgi:purine-nucleoside phosphorylase
MEIIEKIQNATEYIQTLSKAKPTVGVILGSGLGVYVDEIENKTIIPYEDIPGFHRTTVEGHQGRLILGQVKGVEVAVLQGRYHVYEGHGLDEVVLPTRVLSLLGCEFLILTNAAGGINSDYVPGDLVYIKDHINMTGRNPLIGPNISEFGPRFPDMTQAYDPELIDLIESSAKALDFKIKGGVYCALLGPTYETPAEIKMLRILGGDLVGMSTVPESIAANHLGMRVAGISCVTNLAAGIGNEKLSHEDVKEVAKIAMNKFSNLLTQLVSEIGQKL